MKNFIRLVHLTFSRIFRDQQSFWVIVAVGIAISAFLLFLQDALRGKYDFSTQEGIGVFFQDIFASPGQILILLLFIATSIIAPVLYDFFQKNSLSKLIHWRRVDLSNFFTWVWRFFPMIGTNICAVLYSLLYLIPLFIILVILAVITTRAGIDIGNSSETWSDVIIFTYIFFSPIAIVSIWVAILLTFTTATFYLDDVRYFDAVRKSRELVRNRWWKTFFMVLWAGIICFAPVTIFESWVKVIPPTGIYGVNFLLALIVSVLRIGGAMMFFSFLCILYEEYQSGNKKISPSEKPKNTKIKKRSK